MSTRVRNDGQRDTCATCGGPCRSIKRECLACQARRLAGDFYSPDVLLDGRWVPRGGIVIWVDDELVAS